MVQGSLQLLETSAYTISGENRYVKGRAVTVQGGCSLGHLAVALAGSIEPFLMNGSGAIHAVMGNPESQRALHALATAMLPTLNKIRALESSLTYPEKVLSNPNACKEIVISFNDHPRVDQGQVVAAFEEAIRIEWKRLAPIPREREDVSSLDFAKIESMLAESAKEKELVTA